MLRKRAGYASALVRTSCFTVCPSCSSSRTARTCGQVTCFCGCARHPDLPRTFITEDSTWRPALAGLREVRLKADAPYRLLVQLEGHRLLNAAAAVAVV